VIELSGEPDVCVDTVSFLSSADVGDGFDDDGLNRAGTIVSVMRVTGLDVPEFEWALFELDIVDCLGMDDELAKRPARAMYSENNQQATNSWNKNLGSFRTYLFHDLNLYKWQISKRRSDENKLKSASSRTQIYR
jgi:hypothetical protein